MQLEPARLPGFHTCVGMGMERQDPAFYEANGALRLSLNLFILIRCHTLCSGFLFHTPDIKECMWGLLCRKDLWMLVISRLNMIRIIN